MPLIITIPSSENYDEVNNEFIKLKAVELKLEHSLVSLSKWESKWCKPFLTSDNKPIGETLDYIRFMTITQNIDPIVYTRITPEIISEVMAYIEAPMTATILPKFKSGSHSKEIITSEIIYYWMINFNVPFECQTWHLNRLLTLINVCNIKNQPAKRMSKKELYKKNRELNALRKEQYKTKG